MRTPLVAYIATGYAAPLPPNAWASEDLAGLRSLGAEGNLLEEKRLVDFHEAPPWESKEQWLRELRRQIETSAPGGPTKRAIIIYLSLHGAVDGQGEPCLIPPGVSPWQSGEWIRVRELLGELFASRDEKGVWSSRTRGLDKLLVLDCNRIDADWRLGQFYNAFAQRLRDVVQKADVPKLYVLNSTSPGQTAWSAPELQGSVFGHFFAQGLSGAADLDSEGGNNNHQVSLRELHSYLKAHVNQWVTENRDDRQEPMLLPDNAPDVPLVFLRCGPKQGQNDGARPCATLAGTAWRGCGRSTRGFARRCPIASNRWSGRSTSTICWRGATAASGRRLSSRVRQHAGPHNERGRRASQSIAGAGGRALQLGLGRAVAAGQGSRNA